jgi:hypothetical protein
VAAGLGGFALLSGGTTAGWGQGILADTTGSTSSGTLAFVHAYPSTTCAAGPGGTVSRSCSGDITPDASPPASGGATAVDTITNLGSLGSGRLSQSVTVSSCAPVRFTNTRTASDPMLPRYGTAFQQPDKWGTTSATTLSGAGYATDVAATDTSSLLTDSYSMGVWFKVASGYDEGGGLLSLSASPSNKTSGSTTPTLWMSNGGRIEFRVAGTSRASTGATSTAYDDGRWHLAVLSVAVSGTSTGGSVATPTLYVDSASGVTGSSVYASTAGTAYWHLGWADFSGVTAPSSAYLHGSLAGGFVRGDTITSSRTAALYAATSAADYSTKLLALTDLRQLWMLGDPGTTTFTGTLPSSMTAPCGQVNVTLGFANPLAVVATQSLAALADGDPRSVPAPGSGSTQLLTVTTSRRSSYSTDIAGLHLYAPMTIAVTTMPSSSWALAFTWSDDDSAFLG